MSKTYILYPRILKGDEAEEWYRTHLFEAVGEPLSQINEEGVKC